MAYDYDYRKRGKSKGRIKNPFKQKRRKRGTDITKIVRKKEVLLIAFVGVCVAVSTYFFFYEYIAPSGARSGNLFTLLPELMLTDYSMASVDVLYNEQQGIVTLSSGCKRIIAYVEPYQAESIYRGINNIYVARPNSHDIAMDAIQSFGIEVVMVKVTELKESAFYGRIILKDGNKIVSLDARPSDATAIAVRAKAPIYVKNDLLETQGEDIC